ILSSFLPGMFAEALISLHEFPRKVTPFGDSFEGLTASDGYAAAWALNGHTWLQDGARSDARSASPIGRSGPDRACTNQFGERSKAARLSTHRLVAPRSGSPDSSSRVANPKFAFTLKSASQESSDLDLLLDSNDWTAHSVEIVQSHHPGAFSTLSRPALG